VGLYGELGSGKTTFIKYLAKSFGIEETIQSPTYVIMKRHEIRDTSNEVRKKLNPPNIVTRNSCFVFFFHIDAYRIEKEEEMLNLGWLKIISDPKNLICIEWPENISGIMPEHTMIKFEHVKDLEKASETERKISIA